MSDVTATADAVAGTSTIESPSQGIGASSPSKIKTKIDGIEQEVDIEELTKGYQKAKSSDQRFQEAAQLRKEAQEERAQVNALLEKAQKGDLSWLKGLVPKETLNKWAEENLLEHINWEQMPEAEKRATIAERRAAELEARENERTHNDEQKRSAAQEQQAYQLIEQDMVSAIKDLGYDYKITPRFVRRIAEQVYASLEASEDPNAQPMPANIASKHAFDGMKQDAAELLSVLSPAEVMRLLPAKVRAALRSADVEEAMSQMPMGVRQTQEGVVQRPSKTKRMSTDDRFALLDKRFGRG